MQSLLASLFGPRDGTRDYAPLLKWLMVIVLIVAGVIALWFFGFVEETLDADRTRISLVILAIFVGTSLHCMTQTISVSRELISARKAKEAIERSGGRKVSVVDNRVVTAGGDTLEPGIMATHIRDLVSKARTLGQHHLDQTILLRSLADQLRSREKLGLFVSESLLRLALLGTAVGFILMLIPISELDSFEVTNLRQTLTGMSEGMSIALTVTVTGIATALLLKFQYYLLDEGIADLFRMVTETTEVYVVPTLEPAPDAAGE